MLKAFWLRLFLFALVGGLLAFGISSFMPKKYEAFVDVMIDQKPIVQSVAMSAAESTVTDLIDFARPRSLATTVQQIVSYGTISEAANKVAAQLELPAPIPGQGDLDPIKLMQDVSVSAEAQSDIIGLRIRHEKPEYAKAIAQEIYLAFNEQNHRSTAAMADQAIKSLKEQLGEVQAQLGVIDTTMKDLKDKAGAADINLKIQSDMQQVTTLQTQRDMALMEMNSARARVASLEGDFAKLPERQNAGDTKSLNPMRQKYEGELAGSRIKLSDLRTRYTEQRPEVIAARQEVWALEALVKKTPAFVDSQTTETPNDSVKVLRNALAEAKAAYAGAQDRYNTAEQELNSRKQIIVGMPEIQKQLTAYQREQVSLERLVLGYLERLKSLEAAKVGRLSPVREVTTPTVNPEPVSPRPLQNALFGAVGGLLLGILSMLATEAKRQPVRSLAQLNALALRPVYRMVPELRQPFRGLNKAPAEAFDSLLQHYTRSSKRPYRIAVVGVTKDSGASTAAINLAIAGSRHGARVLMVQCDPRGGVSRLLGKQAPAPGDIAEASPLIKVTSAETILTLTTDRNPEITAEVTSQEADLTIIDLEPSTQSAEYAFLAPHVDEVILLVRAGRAKSVEFLQAQQALKESGCPCVTVAFTRSSDLAVVTDSVEKGTQELPTRVVPDEE